MRRLERGAEPWLLGVVGLLCGLGCAAAAAELVALAVGSLGVALVVLASCAWALPWGGFVPVLSRQTGAANLVALTFDDGPDPQTTPAVLQSLAQVGARATFFLVGEKARQYPEVVRAIAAAGHELAVHGQAHAWQPLLSADATRSQIEAGRASIAAALGSAPTLLPRFRPAYGVSTPALAVAVRNLGVEIVAWSRRGFDTRRDPVGAKVWAERLGRRVVGGDILLLHDAPERLGGSVPLTVQALPQLLAALAQRGLRAGSVADLCGPAVGTASRAE